ncbi:hypothetical protein UY3_03259 [Chelonia mydas]|uniref:Uncharacterized protein n=1 Tax=Chelonia mydas TaxID=8469 RepID=M7BQI4_CHEMY|nr:hypothetical protein UY3_03259 [Chelonia mydas]
MLLYRATVKELRNAYHKAREANHRSGAAPQTCRFYKELDIILGGDPTFTAKSTVDTLAGLEPVESGPNQRRKSLMKRWRLKKMWIPMMRPVRSCSPFRTCLASVCSRPLASQKQERRPLFTTALLFIVNYASPDFTLRTNPPTAAEPLCKIRKRLRWTKEDMFQMVLQQSEIAFRTMVGNLRPMGRTRPIGVICWRAVRQFVYIGMATRSSQGLWFAVPSQWELQEVMANKSLQPALLPAAPIVREQ